MADPRLVRTNWILGELRDATEKANKRMFWLTWTMVILTAMIAILTGFLVWWTLIKSPLALPTTPPIDVFNRYLLP